MAHVELLYFWKLKQACSNLFLIATFEAKQMESSHVLHLLRCLGQLYESHISMVKSMNHPHFFHGWLTLVPCKQALFSVVKSIMFQLFSPPFFLANSMNPPFFSTIFARSSQFFHGNHPNYSQELGAQMREEALKGARPMGALLMVKSEAGTPFCFGESGACGDGSMGNSTGKPWKALSGWWFGTWLLQYCPFHIWDVILPIDGSGINIDWLVVWNMNLIFPNSWDDDPIWLYFSEG